MNTKNHSLLVEKYRSTNLDEYVGNDHIKKQIQKYLDQDDIQNFKHKYYVTNKLNDLKSCTH